MRNIDIKVLTATLIGPQDYLTIGLCMAVSRTGEWHDETPKSINHLQGGMASPEGLIMLRVGTTVFEWHMHYLLTY